MARELTEWFAIRLSHFRALWQQQAFSRWIALGSFVYGCFSWWRDEFATTAQQESLRAIKVLPHWPVSWWVAIFFVAMTVWIFESSYRLNRGLGAATANDLHGLGDTRELTLPDISYDIAERDGLIVVRRSVDSQFSINLPRNPAAGKNIDIAKATDDKSGYITVNGNGRRIVGREVFGLSSPGQSITVRYSGIEWVIL
jgi:hypothetical protein